MEAVLEQRVDTLENVLERFITTTNRTLLRIENGFRNLQSELKMEAKRLDDKIAEQNKQFKEEIKTTDEQFRTEIKTIHEQFRKEMKIEADRMNKQWGDMANKMGTLVEDIVAPSIKRAAVERFGFKRIDFFGVRVEKTKVTARGVQKEFDVIVVGEDKVLINETKSKPSSEYIKKFIDFLAKEEFYDYFPEYKEKKLIPVFSTMYMPADVLKRLTKKRIFAMGMSDYVMTILNYDECRSR